MLRCPYYHSQMWVYSWRWQSKGLGQHPTLRSLVVSMKTLMTARGRNSSRLTFIHSCSFKRPGYTGSHDTYIFQSSTSCLMFTMWRFYYCQILIVWKSSPLRDWRNLTYILFFFQWFMERYLTKLYFLFMFYKTEIFCHYLFWGE